jgi:hypothetical protein
MSHPNHKQHQQTRYYKQITNGKCVSCTETAIEGKTKCQFHLDYCNNYGKARLKKRKSEGLCWVCKKPANEAYNGRVCCKEHIMKALVKRRKTTKIHIATGLCRNCKSPAVEDRTMCEKHLAYVKEQNTARIELARLWGVCRHCGALPEEGKTMCSKHLAYGRKNNKERKYA